MLKRHLYMETADRVRDQLIAGRWDGVEAHTRRMPTVDELARELDVSFPTVRRALELLSAEGLVSVRAGASGTYASPERVPLVRWSPLSQRGRWDPKGVANMSDRGTTRLLDVVTRATNEREAVLMGVATGHQVVVRTALVSHDGSPTALHRSLLPHDLVEGSDLTAPQLVQGAIYGGLLRLGLTPHARDEEVGARMPSTKEAGALGITTMVPVLQVTTRTFGSAKDERGRVIYAGRTTVRADKAVLSFAGLSVDPDWP